MLQVSFAAAALAIVSAVVCISAIACTFGVGKDLHAREKTAKGMDYITNSQMKLGPAAEAPDFQEARERFVGLPAMAWTRYWMAAVLSVLVLFFPLLSDGQKLTLNFLGFNLVLIDFLAALLLPIYVGLAVSILGRVRNIYKAYEKYLMNFTP